MASKRDCESRIIDKDSPCLSSTAPAASMIPSTSSSENANITISDASKPLIGTSNIANSKHGLSWNCPENINFMHWKKIYQAVIGYSKSITNSILCDILQKLKTDITKGLLYFEPYDEATYKSWLKNAGMEQDINEFINDLSRYLNLKANITHLVLSNYLMFQYIGKLKEFCQIVHESSQKDNLKKSIFKFYINERMFLLKTLRHILEYSFDENYIFANEYSTFFDSSIINALQKNLLIQLDCLFKNLTPDRLYGIGDLTNSFVFSSIREQIEVFLILIATLKFQPLNYEQMIELIKTALSNYFGTRQFIYQNRSIINPKDLEQLTCVEITTYLLIFTEFWENNDNNKGVEFFKLIPNDLVKALDTSHLHISNGVITLNWSLFKYKLNEDNMDEGYNFRRNVYFLNGLVNLNKILSNEIFNNEFFKNFVLPKLTTFVEELFVYYSETSLFYNINGVVDVLNNLLNCFHVAKLSIQHRNGLDAIIETSIESFPFDFLPLTKLFTTLLQHSELYDDVSSLLTNMTTYLTDISWISPSEQISIIQNRQPITNDCDTIVLEPGTIVKSFYIHGKHYVQYKKVKYSYFTYLNYFTNLFINEYGKDKKLDDDRINKISHGYLLLKQLIKFSKKIYEESLNNHLEELLLKLEKIIFLMDNNIDMRIIEVYFKVYYAIIKYKKTAYFSSYPDLLIRLFFPKIDPIYLQEININILVFNQGIFNDSILTKISENNEYQETDIVLMFVRLVKQLIYYSTIRYNNISISAVLYILNRVFLQHQKWKFKQPHQRSKLLLYCLQIFHFILQKNPDNLYDTEKQLFNFCLCSFFENQYIIEGFTRLFLNERHYTFYLMKSEYDWNNGKLLIRFECIRTQLALLLLLMNLSKKYKNKAKEFYNVLPSLVKPIAFYFNSNYSPVITELSCRFFEKLAQNKDIKLLALLEYDHYQVQTLFLEKLRDPLESETVKIIILDLINTCIEYQDGMTAAFFNLHCFVYWDATNLINDINVKGNSFSEFMLDYLNNIKISYKYFSNPLQVGILKVLTKLWNIRHDILLKQISSINDFWTIMCKPFFCDYILDKEIYYSILNIINSEINSNIIDCNKDLLQILKIFISNEERIQLFSIYVLHNTKENIDNEQDKNLKIQFIKSWLEFLTLTRYILPDAFCNNIKLVLIESCLDGLIGNSNIPMHIEILYHWLQLYLILITSWHNVFSNNPRFMFNRLLYTFDYILKTNYKCVPYCFKNTLFSIVYRITSKFTNYLNDNITELQNFLKTISNLFDLEFYNFQLLYNQSNNEVKIKLIQLQIIMIATNDSLLTMDNVNEIALWFSYQNYINRLVDIIIKTIEHTDTLPFAKIAIGSLIIYGKSPFIKDFLTSNIKNLFLSIGEPVVTFSIDNALEDGFPIDVKEWWLIFTLLIKLNQILLKNLNGLMLEHTFCFMQTTCKELCEILILPTYTLDLSVLTLIIELAKLMNMLLDWKSLWINNNLYNYYNLLSYTKISFNACVLAIIGSKKISIFNIYDGNKLKLINKKEHSSYLSDIVNKLLEIVYWLSHYLKKHNFISIQKLLNETYINPQREILISVDFSLPRFELPNSPKLTYGTLLALAHYLCKVLNQPIPVTYPDEIKSTYKSILKLDYKTKSKGLSSLMKYVTSTHDPVTSFIIYLPKPNDVFGEKLSTLVYYEISEYSGSTIAVTTELNYYHVKNALESLMNFITGEILLALRFLKNENLFYYKRDLSCEIQFFYEFVRKRFNEQLHISSSSECNEKDDIFDKKFLLLIWKILTNYCDLAN